MIRVFLSLGSNVEPRESYLQCAVKQLAGLGRISAVAPLYENPPYGVTEQGAFLNSAVELFSDVPPGRLLNAVKRIERKCGRRRRFRWGPREIDIDIIFYGRRTVRLKRLTVPHIDFHNRPFVLQPLVDIDPDFVPPGDEKTICEILHECPNASKLILLRENWTEYDTAN